MGNKLGKWAVVDIETSGINPLDESIIDVGYLQFEGTKLVRTYESLVQFPMSKDMNWELSQFIQKLTGIDEKMLKNAPPWSQVEPEVMELYGHHLVAHNASFEKSFFDRHFDKIATEEDEREKYEDSLYYLAALHPGRQTLNLESFIIDYGLADKELHRGYQDSVDLLKVMLLATYRVKKDRELALVIESSVEKYQLQNQWFNHFFHLNNNELEEIANQIDFDLHESYEKYLDKNADDLISDTIDLGKLNIGFDGQTVKDILRDEERIRKALPNYKFRDSQEELALKTGQSFKNHVHSIVQAPTGTGKTLGYLIPSALYALSEQKQILVATGTKTLQQQAMEKDVPLLRKILGLDESQLRVERLVGSSNHFCELLFRNDDGEGELFDSSRDILDRFADFYLDLLFHNNGREETPDILRADVPYVLKMRSERLRELDRTLAVDYKACTGSKCPFKGKCSYINGLRKAKDANIVIGNHALMFTWPKAFPRPAHIVVDEAHKIEEETTKSYTLELSQEILDGLNKSLLHLQGIGSLFYLLAQNEETPGDSSAVINQIREKTLFTQKMLGDHLIPLPEVFERHFQKLPRYTEEYWNEAPMPKTEGGSSVTEQSILNHFKSIKTILEDYYEDLLPFTTRWEIKNMEDDMQITALTRFMAFNDQIEDILLVLEKLLNETKEFSKSLKYHATFGYAALAAPIDVGRVLHDGLLSTSSSVVFTSATLSNAEGDQGSKGIEWSTGYLYLDRERRFKNCFFLPAVYDYKNKTKVFLCDDAPPFYDPNFVEASLLPIFKLMKDLKGRSLLLFSSKKRFEAARELLLSKLDGDMELFIQGMGNSVVEDFKKSPNGILLGMESFGEGIDIPGDVLQFVFIDKIPDLRMDLVIQKRREFYDRNIGNEFTDYYLSHRTRALQQKLGRLLRTEKDIGGVIIVDSRIKRWKGRTMDKVLRLMEPYQIERAGLDQACEEIKDFLQ